jgi:hypothetical protein
MSPSQPQTAVAVAEHFQSTTATAKREIGDSSQISFLGARVSLSRRAAR